MKIPSIICFILWSIQSLSCQEIRMDQSPPQVKKPGESVKISCKISGYDMTSYYMHWIRQKPGKALEWIGRVNSGTTHEPTYAGSMKDHFKLTEDVSTSTQFLEAKSLRAEDTAVYYCARQYTGGANYFDYWGKGTSVTVSSGVQTPPTSLFTVSACTPSSDGFITIGCATSGFSPPEPLKFSWTGDVSDVLQYPAVQQGGTYTAVTHARVKVADWEAEKSFTCQADYPGSTTPISGDVKKPVKPPVPVQAPTLLLTAPIQTELETGVATFVCIARKFSPKEHTFKWIRGTEDVTAQAQPTVITEETTNITAYTAISILEISARDWMDMLFTLKCEVTHQDKTFTKEAKYTPGSDEETEKVEITPPCIEDMLVRGAGELQCHAKGRPGFRDIQWLREGQKITSDVHGEKGGTFLTATAKIDYADWSKGTVYTCEVEHKLFAEVKKPYTYSRKNGGEKTCPSVYLLAPPENSQEGSVTLTCYVKNFYPKDVVVYWLANDKILNSTEDDSIVYQHRTSCPIETEKDRLYSVYSQLVISSAEWETGTVFSCLVYHEAINPTVRTISRSLDNASGKPTVVSLSMSVPSTPGCIA